MLKPIVDDETAFWVRIEPTRISESFDQLRGLTGLAKIVSDFLVGKLANVAFVAAIGCQ